MRFLSTIVIAVIVISLLYFTATPAGRAQWNSYWHDIQKVDDATKYETRKQVEDTCRATIVSYESDKLTWEQYTDSDNEEQRGWAEAAKMRDNKAAVTYNEYFMKNSYVFEGNVPADIRTNLPILE